MRSYYLCIIAFTFLIVSCKKDNLDGDMAIIVGEWEWVSTDYMQYICDGPSIVSILTPQNKNAEYAIRFKENGRAEFFKNEQLISKHRVVVNTFSDQICFGDRDYFGIFLDNNESNIFQCCLDDSSMTVYMNFPFLDPKDNCENYTNYFVRVQ